MEPTETLSAWQVKYRIESAQEQVDNAMQIALRAEARGASAAHMERLLSAGARFEERLVELRRLAGVR